MNNIVKSQKGITLIALVITIIVLLIISGIGIGQIVGNKGDINQTKDALALSDLSKVQQAVLENYIKYKQLENEEMLVGTSMDINSAKTELSYISDSEKLKALNDQSKPENKYYILNKTDLKNLGLENINDTYIVNYSTGEVFDTTKKKTIQGEPLYIYAKDLSN